MPERASEPDGGRRGPVGAALGAVRRWLARVGAASGAGSPAADPWARVPRPLPLRRFGRGAVHEFRWYFEGESAVAARSLDDVCEWLRGCEYIADRALFHEPDFWQHPQTFEQLRRGDCEDFALWAWRKLTELGIEAELMAGLWAQSPARVDGHVWVCFRLDERTFLLESVARSRERMIRPLEDARAEYTPFCAVDQRFRSYEYAGSRRRGR